MANIGKTVVGRWLATLLLMAVLLLLVIAGCGKAESPNPQPAQPSAGASGWDLVFEYSEVSPNPGAGAPRMDIRLAVAESGSFTLHRSVHAVSGELTSSTQRSGVLPSAQLQELARTLSALDLSSYLPGPVDLAGGSGTEDGWGGVLSLTEAGVTIEVHYSSRGGYPLDPSAAERLSRFGEFINEMRVLSLRELERGSS